MSSPGSPSAPTSPIASRSPTSGTPIKHDYKSNYCLYKKEGDVIERREDDQELRVEAIATDLDTEEESALRKHVITKANKNLIFKSGTIGVVSSIQRSTTVCCYFALLELAGKHLDDNIDTDNAPEEREEEDTEIPLQQAQPKRQSREYYLCLLCEVGSDRSLELFQLELKGYCDHLTNLLQQHRSNISAEWANQLLSSWYHTCVLYARRCVNLLGEDLSIVLHSAFLGRPVIVNGPASETGDLTKLVRAISIINQSPIDDDTEQTDPLSGVAEGNRLVVSVTSSQDSGTTVQLSTRETNEFCKQWTTKLRDCSMDPFHLRACIEDLKLSVIQELNFVRKLVDQAKLNNYSLYKVYSLLLNDSNGDVLMNLLLKDITNDSAASEVLEVIQQCINMKKRDGGAPLASSPILSGS
jgi:hypothetical protein